MQTVRILPNTGHFDVPAIIVRICVIGRYVYLYIRELTSQNTPTPPAQSSPPAPPSPTNNNSIKFLIQISRPNSRPLAIVAHYNVYTVSDYKPFFWPSIKTSYCLMRRDGTTSYELPSMFLAQITTQWEYFLVILSSYGAVENIGGVVKVLCI